MLDSSRIDPRQLRNAFGCFASGVTVVSLRDGEGRSTGITVNSFSSLSLDPPLVLFSVGTNQVSCRWFENQDYFNVNVLSAEQEHVAWQFAKPMDDKFEGIPSYEAPNGMPVIEGAVASFECRKFKIVEGGDHIIVIGEVLDFNSIDAEPLLFYRGKMRRIGA